MPHQGDDDAQHESDHEAGQRVEHGVLQRQRDDVREHLLGDGQLRELVLQPSPVRGEREGEDGGDEDDVLRAA
jgi:hypothetical protein